jgi:hypothetical protein
MGRQYDSLDVDEAEGDVAVTVGGTLVFALYLLVWSLAYCLPLMLVVWFVRRRLTPNLGGGTVAFAFAVATAVVLYQVEWFDMFRNGMPPLRYFKGWLPWIAPYAALGWFIGYRLARRPHNLRG